MANSVREEGSETSVELSKMRKKKAPRAKKVNPEKSLAEGYLLQMDVASNELRSQLHSFIDRAEEMEAAFEGVMKEHINTVNDLSNLVLKFRNEQILDTRALCDIAEHSARGMEELIRQMNKRHKDREALAKISQDEGFEE